MRRLTLVALLLASTLALADLTLVNEAVAGGKTRTVTLSVKGGKALFEVKEADGPTRTMMRDAAEKKLFIVDHDKKAVLIVTEQDSKQLEERQAAMRAQLKAQLDKLPPEQRARMESTMLAQADAKPPAYTYEKKKTPARKVSSYACQDYLIKRDGQPAGEGCFASWKDVGIAADEFKSVMLKAMPSMPGNPMAQGFEAAEGAPGFPLWRQHVGGDGQVTAETTVKSVSRTALGAEKFALPKDYAQKSMSNAIPGNKPPAK